jgi:hypothetical protein
MTKTWWEAPMGGSVLSFLKAERTFQGCFLPSFDSFGLAVSDETIFLRNQPIRNKNCLWRPCLLTDRDEMSILYRGHAIDASYQVTFHLSVVR